MSSQQVHDIERGAGGWREQMELAANQTPKGQLDKPAEPSGCLPKFLHPRNPTLHSEASDLPGSTL